MYLCHVRFFFQAEDGIRDADVTGVQTCALPIFRLDAIPDLSETQVIVLSRWDRSPDILEDQVTYPIVTAMLGAPKVRTVRGVSDFGYSFFGYSFVFKHHVHERISEVRSRSFGLRIFVRVRGV